MNYFLKILIENNDFDNILHMKGVYVIIELLDVGDNETIVKPLITILKPIINKIQNNKQNEKKKKI